MRPGGGPSSMQGVIQRGLMPDSFRIGIPWLHERHLADIRPAKSDETDCNICPFRRYIDYDPVSPE